MSTVYLVTSGSYSDYGIEAVFSTAEKAEAYRWNRADDVRIEEYELDVGCDLVAQGLRTYTVVMRRDGSLQSAIRNAYPAFENDIYRPQSWADNTISVFTGLSDLADTWEFHIQTKSEEQALKIANERRGMMLATETWDKGIGWVEHETKA